MFLTGPAPAARRFLAGFLWPWPIVAGLLTRRIGRNAYPATHVLVAGRAVAERMLVRTRIRARIPRSGRSGAASAVTAG